MASRWRKLLRDLSAERGRVLLMVTAIAVSLSAVGTVLGAYAVLTREIAVNYLGTRPASATLEVEGGIDPALLERIRTHPLVADAEAREVVIARTRVGDDWRRTLLFVIDDFSDLRLNVFRSESGAWPPPEGTMLLERSAVPVFGVGAGGSVLVKTPHGTDREVPISGLVHDPGLAPAWQEQSGYGYVTQATIESLGESPALHELRIELHGRPTDARVVEAQAAEVAAWLGAQGHTVHEIRVPPPSLHPHQRQMTTVLLMMLLFAVMALVLSAILIATSLNAMLARQVREIGVMKAIGARSSQIASLYFVMVGALGVASLLVAAPLGIGGARGLTGDVATMLNFTITSATIPAWVFVAQALAALAVPLAVAAWPIGRATRVTVRQAIDEHETGAAKMRAASARLPAVLRSILRRPVRLALTLGLLSAGGAMFMTALNVKLGWEASVAKVYETRSYDVEVVLQSPQPIGLETRIREVPGVRRVEAWGYSRAAFSRPSQIDVVRTYPDRGHGSLNVMGVPPDTRMIRFPVKAGRWLVAGDRDAVVLNHSAAAQAPWLKVGDPVTLSLDGHPTSWTVVGIVEEIGSSGVAYVTDTAFAKAAGTEGLARMYRIASDSPSPAERTSIIRAIDRALTGANAGIESAIPLAELRTAVGDHILILVQMLVSMAVIMAIVGGLGLASTMGISVVERTREIAIMKTLGAAPRRIVAMLIGEGVAIGVISSALAFALSIPVTSFVDGLIGNLGFLAPLPMILSPGAAIGWAALALVLSFGATLVPARRASRLVIREALAHT